MFNIDFMFVDISGFVKIVWFAMMNSPILHIKCQHDLYDGIAIVVRLEKHWFATMSGHGKINERRTLGSLWRVEANCNMHAMLAWPFSCGHSVSYSMMKTTSLEAEMCGNIESKPLLQESDRAATNKSIANDDLLVAFHVPLSQFDIYCAKRQNVVLALQYNESSRVIRKQDHIILHLLYTLDMERRHPNRQHRSPSTESTDPKKSQWAVRQPLQPLGGDPDPWSEKLSRLLFDASSFRWFLFEWTLLFELCVVRSIENMFEKNPQKKLA